MEILTLILAIVSLTILFFVAIQLRCLKKSSMNIEATLVKIYGILEAGKRASHEKSGE